MFNTITTEACEKLLAKVYSVMADTTAINTGKKSGVNKRLQDYIMENVGHDIHTLECLFHVNEIYFTHVVSRTGLRVSEAWGYLVVRGLFCPRQS